MVDVICAHLKKKQDHRRAFSVYVWIYLLAISYIRGNKLVNQSITLATQFYFYFFFVLLLPVTLTWCQNLSVYLCIFLSSHGLCLAIYTQTHMKKRVDILHILNDVSEFENGVDFSAIHIDFCSQFYNFQSQSLARCGKKLLSWIVLTSYFFLHRTPKKLQQ